MCLVHPERNYINIFMGVIFFLPTSKFSTAKIYYTKLLNKLICHNINTFSLKPNSSPPKTGKKYSRSDLIHSSWLYHTLFQFSLGINPRYLLVRIWITSSASQEVSWAFWIKWFFTIWDYFTFQDTEHFPRLGKNISASHFRVYLILQKHTLWAWSNSDWL